METPAPAFPLNPPSPSGFFRRKDFPNGFIFGSSTSAFQIEGGLREGHRVPSNWDAYSVEKNLYAPYHENSIGHYYRYKEDVRIMKAMGFDAYRFSIAWSRVMTKEMKPNEEGIDFYHCLLDEILANDIEPFVTLWHFVHPKVVDDYGAFLNPKMVEDYTKFVDLCFSRFGKKVKKWITFNEPSMYCILTFVRERMPTPHVPPHFPPFGKPGFTPLHPMPFRNKLINSTSGEQPTTTNDIATSGEQPTTQNVATSKNQPTTGDILEHPDIGKFIYGAGHILLFCHASAVHLYREKYQALQQGQIAITLCTYCYVPYSDLPKDQEAAQRALDFELGWFLHPIVTGDYPETMRNFVSDDRLPKFSKGESALVKGSFDFIGLNYYSARFVADNPYATGRDYYSDQHLTIHTHRGGVPIGEPTDSSWLFVYPRGIMNLLIYMKNKYNNPTIYITENGMADLDDQEKSLWEVLYDDKRVSYYFQHLWYVKTALWLGVNVKGYFPWSLLDSFEWSNGYKLRFGLNYVDFKNGDKTGSTRYPKLSAGWFKYLLEK